MLWLAFARKAEPWSGHSAVGGLCFPRLPSTKSWMFTLVSPGRGRRGWEGLIPAFSASFRFVQTLARLAPFVSPLKFSLSKWLVALHGSPLALFAEWHRCVCSPPLSPAPSVLRGGFCEHGRGSQTSGQPRNSGLARVRALASVLVENSERSSRELRGAACFF